MLYVIRAYEQSYGGLHGIETWCAYKADSLQDVEEYASELSRELMGNYSFIEEALEEQAEFYCDDPDDEEAFNNAYDEAMEENIAYSIWEVQDEENGIIEINKFLSSDPEGYVSEKCILAVSC